MGARDESKVRRRARMRPGALYIEGYEAMKKFVPQLAGSDWIGPGEGGIAPFMANLPTVYLTTALLPQAKHLNPGVVREMRTLTEILEAAVHGDHLKVADLAMQRYRALEVAHGEGTGWTLARHLEVLPETRVTSVSTATRAAMLSRDNQEQNTSYIVLLGPRVCNNPIAKPRTAWPKN